MSSILPGRVTRILNAVTFNSVFSVNKTYVHRNTLYYANFKIAQHSAKILCCPASSYSPGTVVQRGLSSGGAHSAEPAVATPSASLGVERVGSQVDVSPDTIADPLQLVQNDMIGLVDEIRQELSSRPTLSEIATYYFDGRGKSMRPLITLLIARAVNAHHRGRHRLLPSQREVAKIAEMIHTSTLLHDDVIDGSDTRRGKPALHSLYSHRKAVMCGDYVLSVASTMLARIKNEDIIILLSNVLVDLVQGEFMQLGSKENEDERFSHYLKKTFNKTASLIAFSCEAVALLSGASSEVQSVCFEYGKNCGIAFQLVDDMLDFTSTTNSLGKPNLNDLKSGLATAPVLFACEKYPDLHPMIMRRFTEPGDVKKAVDFVLRSDGLRQTNFLAHKHCQEAIRQISKLKESPEKDCLIAITDTILNRKK